MGVERDGEEGLYVFGFLSNRMRGQLQECGCWCRSQVMEAHFCAFCDGDVWIFPFSSLAMDGTEIRIHQLHDLSQLSGFKC